MKPVTIPIQAIGPMNAEPDEGLDFMPMPRDMSTFVMPNIPDAGPDADVDGAHQVLAHFIRLLDAWLDQGGELPALELRGLPADTLRVLNETLGEGEVAAFVGNRDEVRVQETVFAGVWRQQHFDSDGVLLHDLLIAAPVPPLLLQQAREGSTTQLRPLPLPAGAMNVPALISELQDAIGRVGRDVPAHVVNLTLLPLSPEDSAHIDALLEGGRVVILSRGFGNCRISSTAARHVWRVQYFNNMQTLILNTVEVTELPDAAMATRDDLIDSRERLHDLAQWMSESLEAA